MYKMREKKGFSMIEILVVISIIGFLASSAFYAVNIARARSRDAKRVSDISSISKAMEIYFNENSSYPEPADGFNNGECINYDSEVAQKMLTQKILTNIPGDPIWPDSEPLIEVAGYVSEGEINFCYYIFPVDASHYYLSYYLETSSQAGEQGPHYVSQEGVH
jgi:prepilin-type N-terminal cleavage/methylation domain-containing protein